MSLNRIRITRTLFGVISSYLDQRSASLAHDGKTITKEITKGCPQGSVLGPLLWNITFDAWLIKEFPPGAIPIAFADDVAFVISGNTRRQVETVGNQTMEILLNWARHAKFEISSQKFKLVIVKAIWILGNMKYRNIRIGKVDSATYFGIKLDNGFTFLPHIKKQGTKAYLVPISKNWQIIKSKLWCSHRQRQLPVQNSIIMGYASNVWIQKVDNTAIKKNIKETQRQVLISTTGAYRTSPFQDLCVIFNNPPINWELIEIKELGDRAKGRLNETKTQIRQRTLARWKEEWFAAITGRGYKRMRPSKN